MDERYIGYFFSSRRSFGPKLSKGNKRKELMVSAKEKVAFSKVAQILLAWILEDTIDDPFKPIT